MEKTEKIEWAMSAIFVILLIAFSAITTSFFSDDLGFDFAGYAIRYQNAFAGWFFNHHFGLPASIFDPWLPALLPLSIQMLGIGKFTTPLAISILLIRLVSIIAIAFLAKQFGARTSTAILLGSIIAINPITLKFLNRYYELFAWTAAIFAMPFYYRYLKSIQTRKSFFLATIFALIAVLSHQITAIFLAVFCISITKPETKEAKKLLAFFGFLFFLSLFWTVPFFYYLPYSGIQGFSGSGLQTTGIFASSVFLVLLLAITSLFFRKARLFQKYQRESQLLFITLVLAIVRLLLPFLPVIEKPFSHSYHFFYLLVLTVAFSVLVKEKVPEKISIKKIAVPAVIGLILLLFFFSKISGNYLLAEPRLSSYEIEGERIDFSEVNNVLSMAGNMERIEFFPLDPVLDAYATSIFGLQTAYGWGYNGVSLYNSNARAEELASFAENNCQRFNALSREMGVSKWIALNQKSFDALKQCGWQTERNNAPSLFYLNERISLAENGEVIAFSKNAMTVKVFPPQTILKVNYFPKWKAYSGETSVEISRAENNFIMLKTNKQGIIELKYEDSFVEQISLAVSAISGIILLAFVSRKEFFQRLL